MSQPADFPLWTAENTAGLEYAPYFQGESDYYLGEASSSGSGSALTNSTADTAAPTRLPLPRPSLLPPATAASKAAVRRRGLERRGHMKSRRGCFNCKRRRIKVREKKKKRGRVPEGNRTAETSDLSARRPARPAATA